MEIKEWWKLKPYWFKSAIITTTFGLLVFIITMLYGIFIYQGESFFPLPLFIIWAMSAPTSELFNELFHTELATLLGSILGTIINFFIVGSLIGWIIGKIKK